MITRDVLFVVLLSTSYILQYSFSIFIKENELKEFLSTNDFIWTYNTSNKRDNHWCEVDVTERLQEKSIVYKHSYYRKFPLKEKFSVMMQGVFKYPSNMISSTKGSKVQFKHHLTYLDSDKSVLSSVFLQCFPLQRSLGMSSEFRTGSFKISPPFNNM
uniref:Putative lipocalin n=1 Tax=Rhipicephalus microplus TaxID=6941 RepID=A0A6G5A2D7_RHIMP